MIAFVDTSSLFKKYVNEQGTEEVEKLLTKVSEIIIAPTAKLEIFHALSCSKKDGQITAGEYARLMSLIQSDFQYFATIAWAEGLEERSIELMRKYALKTLDCIQLACASIAQPDYFLTSDKVLFQAAKKELSSVILI